MAISPVLQSAHDTSTDSAAETLAFLTVISTSVHSLGVILDQELTLSNM